MLLDTFVKPSRLLDFLACLTAIVGAGLNWDLRGKSGQHSWAMGASYGCSLHTPETWPMTPFVSHLVHECNCSPCSFNMDYLTYYNFRHFFLYQLTGASIILLRSSESSSSEGCRTADLASATKVPRLNEHKLHSACFSLNHQIQYTCFDKRPRSCSLTAREALTSARMPWTSKTRRHDPQGRGTKTKVPSFSSSATSKYYDLLVILPQANSSKSLSRTR